MSLCPTSRAAVPVLVCLLLGGAQVLRSGVDKLPAPPERLDFRGSLFSPGFSVRHSTSDSIVVTLSLSELTISRRTTRAGFTHSVVSAGGERLEWAGVPDLPVYRTIVAVPDGGDVRIVARPRARTVVTGIDVREFALRDNSPSQRSRAILDRMAPLEIAVVEHVGYLRGQRLACVLAFPARYNMARRELEVTTDLELVLTVENATGDVIKNAGPLESVLESTVLNASMQKVTSTSGVRDRLERRAMSGTGQVCWCSGSNWQDTAASAISCGADYLIIVSDSLVSSTMVDTLAQRRANYNGFNVAIVQMSQIDAAPDTASTPGRIRALIDSVYTSESAAHMGDGRLGYVLLMGDAYDPSRQVLIPSYYGYADVNVPKVDDRYRASDAYYSFLDDDPVEDRFPDVLIGRLPLDRDDSDWEITNAVQKIVSYEPLSSDAWADSILLVSGNDPTQFTFSTETLNGFKAFFDSVLTQYGPPGKAAIQEHRLALGSPLDLAKHELFGDRISASMGRGKWITAFFDHGFPFYWSGAFYPRNYEFIPDTGRPSIVFSIGSNTSQFDLTADWALNVMGSCSVGSGCTVGAPSSLQCESPGYGVVDPCDAIAERLLVQEGGAVAVLGYSRSQIAPDAQADFTNLFRCLSQQNPSTLGELLVGARMFRISNDITARNLMLLGDPALDIRTRATSSGDTLDVAIGIHDIRLSGEEDGDMTYYVDANSSLAMTARVRNPWRTDASDVEVECWQGEPGSQGATLLDSTTLPIVAAYGSESISFDVTDPANSFEIFIVVDPDDEIVERNEDNNISSRNFLGLAYEADYPVRLDMTPARPIVAADLTSQVGTEFLVSGGREVRCYAAGDTASQWAYELTTDFELFLNSPVVGHLYKSTSVFGLMESRALSGASQLRVLSGQTGSVSTYSLYQNTSAGLADYKLAKWLVSDLGQDDATMELVTLSYRDGGLIDSLLLQAYTPSGALLTSALVEENVGSLAPATVAVADIDANGSKEVVVLLSVAASTYDLKVYTYASAGFSLLWERDVAVENNLHLEPTLVLLDVDEDGDVEILCSGAWPGHIVRLYDSTGTAVWGSDVSANARPKFAAGDINGDGTAEVVIADSGRIRVVSTATGGLLDSEATAGNAVSGPYLVDLDADGQLDVVSLFEIENHYFFPKQFDTRIYILDENLEVLEPAKIFSPRSLNHLVVPPAIDDLDGDERYEMVYVSTDNTLHVFEIGSAKGEAAWAQRFANALNTGLNEQPILGDGYTKPVSLYQRTRMLGHVTLDSIAAPSLYIGHGTEVLIDTSTVDGYELRAYGSVRIKGSATAPVSFRTVPPSSAESTWHGLYIDNRSATTGDPDTLLSVRLSDAWIGMETRSPTYVGESVFSRTYDTGLHATDWLRVEDSDIVDSDGRGLYVGPGGHATINASRIEYHENTGLTCEECVLSVSNGTSVSYNGLHGVHMIEPANSSLSSSVFQHNDGDGVRCEEGNPTIDACLLRKNDIGMSCWYDANPTMTYSRADSNGVGVSGADDSYPFLGSTDEPGHNCIVATTAHHVVNLNGGTAQIITQRNNYGSICCKSTKFFGPVLCQPCDSVALCDAPSGMVMIIAGSSGNQRDATPKQFDLGAGYPNPFNPIVTIPYDVASPGGRVEIVVYNVLGQRVATLVTGHRTAGRYFAEWRGRDDGGAPTATGVYFVRMTAPGFTRARKILLLK